MEYSSGEVSIIPALTFTRAGRVGSWLLAARRGRPAEGNIPHIQIWRAAETRKRQINETVYTFQDSTAKRGVTVNEPGAANVYEYQLDSPMEVEAGDVVGIWHPQARNSRLSLAFLSSDRNALSSDAPANYITHNLDNDLERYVVSADSEMTRRLPLLRAKFLPSSESI